MVVPGPRYTRDGSFGTDGRIEGRWVIGVADVASTPDGGVLVLPWYATDQPAQDVLAYDRTGTPHAGFGAAGTMSIVIDRSSVHCGRIVAARDGTRLACIGYGGGLRENRLLALTDAGTRMASFGVDGEVAWPDSGFVPLTIPGDTVYLGGEWVRAYDATTGAPDATFGAGGTLHIEGWTGHEVDEAGNVVFARSVGSSLEIQVRDRRGAPLEGFDPPLAISAPAGSRLEVQEVRFVSDDTFVLATSFGGSGLRRHTGTTRLVSFTLSGGQAPVSEQMSHHFAGIEPIGDGEYLVFIRGYDSEGITSLRVWRFGPSGPISTPTLSLPVETTAWDVDPRYGRITIAGEAFDPMDDGPMFVERYWL